MTERADDVPQRRVCIFCGGRPLEKEHVLPKWLKGCWPDLEPQGHYRGRTTPRHGRRDKTYPLQPFETTARYVCETCNHGWMSDLETEAKPLLRWMMVEGRGCSLGEADQRLIARWAVKTVMTVQYAQQDGGQAIPSEQYRWLWQEGTPPQQHQVWLGARVRDELWPYRYDGLAFNIIQRGRRPVPVNRTVDFNAFRAALCIGHLVFHLMGHVLDGGAIFDIPDPMRRAFVEVWPTRARVTWPPPVVLNATAIDSLFDVPASR